MALAVLLAPGAAFGDCAMTYDDFETTVPHLDLEACPAEMAAEARFCRAAMALHGVAVFQFEDAGERCVVQVVRFEEDEVRLTVAR